MAGAFAAHVFGRLLPKVLQVDGSDPRENVGLEKMDGQRFKRVCTRQIRCRMCIHSGPYSGGRVVGLLVEDREDVEVTLDHYFWKVDWKAINFNY